MPADAPHPSQDSPQPASNQQPTHTVVLRHTLQDGTSHFDWLIEIPNRFDEHRLRSFRSESDPTLWHSGQLFPVEQLPEHRARYLSYEGAISENRGSVLRAARGICEMYQAIDESELRVEINWDSDAQSHPEILRYSGKNLHGQDWVFGCG